MNEAMLFILNIRENLTSGMAGIARSSATVFGGLDKRIANTQRQFSMAGKSAGDLNNRISLLTQKRDLSVGIGDIVRANREIEKLEHRVERMQTIGRKGSLGRGAGGGGLSMPWWLSPVMLGGMAVTGIGAMIKVGAEQQRDVVGLSTFMGKERATKFYHGVQNDARLTPFVTHDLMAADRMLISTGMNADRARMDIHNLANAVAATGGGNYQLERMAQHLQLIRGMGHATLLQLKEFTTNGINVIQLLNDATGKHLALTHGIKVSYGAIELALAHAAEKGGLFYGAMEAQSQTIFGKWSTFKDDLIQSAGTIVMGQSGGITGVLDLLDKYALKLPAMAEKWTPAITNITNGIISLVGHLLDMAKWVYNNWTLVKDVVITFYAFKAAIWAVNGITAIYNGVMAIAALRVTALAAAEAEAAAATTGLSSAMLLTPWVAIAGGVAAVAAAYLLISTNQKKIKPVTDLHLEMAQKSTSVEKAPYNALNHIKLVKDTAYYYWDDNKGKMVKPGFRPVKDEGITNFPIAGYGADYWLRGSAIGAGYTHADTPHIVEVAKKAKSYAADKEDGDDIGEGSISGGGRKVINITFRSFVEKMENHFATMDGGVSELEEKFEELFLRTLQSARAAK